MPIDQTNAVHVMQTENGLPLPSPTMSTHNAHPVQPARLLLPLPSAFSHAGLIFGPIPASPSLLISPRT